jgi:hypothetical protein|tara:strand:- start:2522 stop:2821 length:300 start_codon:yes stop_codon:yes gene_type:complete
MELHEAPELYERVIHYDQVKEVQVRLTVSTFRGIEYLSIRKYYMDFEEEWKPSKEGVTMPIDFSNSKELFIGLTEILSLAESKQVLEEHFSDLLADIYK